MNLAAVPFAIAAGGSVACATLALFPPPRRLGPRIAPYTLAARSRMTDTSNEVARLLAAAPSSSSAWRRVLGPIVASLGTRLSALLGHRDDAAIALALDQAGIREVTPRTYRTRQLMFATAVPIGGWVAGSLLSPRTGLVFAAVGVVSGTKHMRADLNKRTKLRKERMRAELLAVCQAVRVHARATPNMQSVVETVCKQGQGEVIGELRRVLAAVSAGTPAAVAYEYMATRTVEPAAATFYRTLARASTIGGDIAHDLSAQVQSIRALRRDDRQKRAKNRTVTMQVAACLLFPLPGFILIFPALPIIFLQGVR